VNKDEYIFVAVRLRGHGGLLIIAVTSLLMLTTVQLAVIEISICLFFSFYLYSHSKCRHNMLRSTCCVTICITGGIDFLCWALKSPAGKILNSDTDFADGGRRKTSRTTCTEVDRRHPDVVSSRHQRSDDDDGRQRQMENIRG